ncbi:MAG: aminodeoxychorismate/anthranilate synthase component II [Actinomycetota bacterium]|nr:aminodeoxychorismate/anthranilate synthase component II [Actinomycetota bacterium]
MRTVIVDAYDSFVHIIYQYMLELDAGPVVVRSDATSARLIAEESPDLVVLGPGPGHPADSGHVEIVRELQGRLPILGICLGHQAIGLAYGATVHPAKHLMHGKTSRIRHDGKGAMSAQEQSFLATRYHSLIVAEDSVPAELTITARSEDDGYVMGLRHVDLPVESVQFHPESITTESGLDIFRSFIDQHCAAARS